MRRVYWDLRGAVDASAVRIALVEAYQPLTSFGAQAAAFGMKPNPSVFKGAGTASSTNAGVNSISAAGGAVGGGLLLAGLIESGMAVASADDSYEELAVQSGCMVGGAIGGQAGGLLAVTGAVVVFGTGGLALFPIAIGGAIVGSCLGSAGTSALVQGLCHGGW